MALDPQYVHRVEAVVRSLSTASRSLRLYPPSSPIPLESAEVLARAIESLFAEGEPVLSLALARTGFSCYGEEVCSQVMGADEFAGELRTHGVAEVDFTPGCTAAELLAFLGVLGRTPEEVRAQGGISACLVAEGVDNIRVIDVQLTVLEQIEPAADQDVDEFLKELARNPDKLASWFAAAAGGDAHAFEESLMELVRVSGSEGYEGMLSALTHAFQMQRPEAKDALLGLSLDKGPTRDLTGAMFSLLPSSDIAGSILGGSFGKNMLSLSAALTKLPLDRVTAEVRAEVQAALPTSGHTTREAQFLEHMIEVRERVEPEKPLVDTDAMYRSALSAIDLSEETIAQARGAVTAAHGAVTASSVRTMLTLLEQQTDFELFCNSVDSLSSMVPKLIEQGDLELALKVLRELSRRSTLAIGPWPDLSERLRQAMVAAAGSRTMGALIHAVTADKSLLPLGCEIIRYGGESAAPALVTEAISLKGPGLDTAEQLLGRRFVDVLSQLALQAQWFQLAAIAARLGKDGEPRAHQTLEALMRRPDEQSRREIATGLAEAGGPAAQRILASALRDPSAEVAMVAARAMARSAQPGVAAIIATRLAELDIDNADFVVGREMIAALARLPEPAADDALAKLASRRALIKRGHFAEVQTLVERAQALRTQAGGAR